MKAILTLTLAFLLSSCGLTTSVQNPENTSYCVISDGDGGGVLPNAGANGKVRKVSTHDKDDVDFGIRCDDDGCEQWCVKGNTPEQ